MVPTYAIHVDAARGLLSLDLRGMWTDDIINAFERDLNKGRARMEAAGLSPDWPRVLVDLTDFRLQTRAVAARFEARIERFHADRRIAFVGVGGQLLQLQFRRVAAIEAHRFFADRDQALAWLLETTLLVSTAA